MQHKLSICIVILFTIISCKSESSTEDVAFDFNFPEDCCQLTQFTINGISDLTSEGIRLYDACAFTPDGTQEGAGIYPIYTNDQIETLSKFDISNSDGQVVFSQENIPPNDQTFGWDGKENGALKDGPYKIDVSFDTTDGSKVNISYIVCVLLCEEGGIHLNEYEVQNLNFNNLRWPSQHDGFGGFDAVAPIEICTQ